MSTRCQIIVRGDKNILLYRHCDGYPEGKDGVIHTLQMAKLHPFNAYEGSKFATAIVGAWHSSVNSDGTPDMTVMIDGEYRDNFDLYEDVEYLYVISYALSDAPKVSAYQCDGHGNYAFLWSGLVGEEYQAPTDLLDFVPFEL